MKFKSILFLLLIFHHHMVFSFEENQAQHLGMIIPFISQRYTQMGNAFDFFDRILFKWNEISDAKDENSKWPFLKNKGFSDEELDFLAYEFCKTINTSHVVIIWPKAIQHLEYITSELNKSGRVIYSRKVTLRGKALPYLIQSIPEKAGSIPLHLQYYFNNQPVGDLVVLLCTFSDLNTAIDCKKRIRQHLKFNPLITVLHVSDTQQQSIDLAQIFFNKNTINYLNQELFPPTFEKFNF